MKKIILITASIVNAVISTFYIAASDYDTIPIHFNIHGEADGFSSRWFMLTIPLIIIVMSIANIFYEKHLERKNKAAIKYQSKASSAVFTFMIVIHWLLMSVCLSNNTYLNQEAFSLLSIMIGTAITYIGNLLGKIEQNPVIGVKTKATKNNKKVWKKTNRLGGLLGVISGIVFIICGILGFVIPFISTILLLSAIIISIVFATIIPTLYSRIIYSKENKNIS